jgi:hypothetical protein
MQGFDLIHWWPIILNRNDIYKSLPQFEKDKIDAVYGKKLIK